MNAPMEAATVQLAAVEERLRARRADLDSVRSQHAEAAEKLSRMLADAAPEAQLRLQTGRVEALAARRDALPGAVALLEDQAAPMRERARLERIAAADAEVARLDRAYAKTLHETVAALRSAARGYLVQHRRMTAARSAAVEARRAALRLTGADKRDVFYAAPDEPRFEGDEDFYTLARLLALYGSAN